MNRVNQKKRRRKINIRRLLFVIIIFLFAIQCLKKFLKIQQNKRLPSFQQITENYVLPIFQKSSGEYEIIKQDTNDNYDGIGQEKVSHQDGYFTTFTTAQPNQKTYIEYKQNGDASWSQKEYWGDTMENSGCGIAALSIILSGYGKTDTPEDLRNKYYPVLNYETLTTELWDSFGIKASGFFYDQEHLSEDYMKRHLLKDKPIFICVWTKPKANRWTTSSHYMVLLASDGQDMVYVSNPNGGENDSKSSGWYKFDEVVPYIAKILFIDS
ncbi:MAG: C39 family peptidase [Clostridia bacterium]|nr:C39 family peptidase [Clostridia bacterium]